MRAVSHEDCIKNGSIQDMQNRKQMLQLLPSVRYSCLLVAMNLGGGPASDVLPPLLVPMYVCLQDSRIFVAVADGGGDGPIRPTVVDIGEAGLISGGWHALVISHRRSSALLFNKDQLEASAFVVSARRVTLAIDGGLGSCSTPHFFRVKQSAYCLLILHWHHVNVKMQFICLSVHVMPYVRESRHRTAYSILTSLRLLCFANTARWSGRTQVFLDGQLFFSASVPYPRRISEPLARCSIGWNLDGQTSGVLLLSGVKSLKIVKSMLNRLAGRPDDMIEGADAVGSSSPDLDLWDDTATVSAPQRLKQKLLGSQYQIFAALLPNRTVDDLCLEPHNGHHGLLRGGTTHVWITHTVQDVISSIGGTPSLLSLATGLLSEAPGLALGRKIPNSFTGRSVDTVLSVLLSFLDGNVANQVRRLLTGLWPHLFELEVCCTQLEWRTRFKLFVQAKRMLAAPLSNHATIPSARLPTVRAISFSREAWRSCNSFYIPPPEYVFPRRGRIR